MITLVYAGFLTLMGLYLAYRTGTKRLSTNNLLGHGDSQEMLQASRVHGNFTEYICKVSFEHIIFTEPVPVLNAA